MIGSDSNNIIILKVLVFASAQASRVGVVDKPQGGEGKDVYFKFQLQSHQGIHLLAMKLVTVVTEGIRSKVG